MPITPLITNIAAKEESERNDFFFISGMMKNNSETLLKIWITREMTKLYINFKSPDSIRFNESAQTLYSIRPTRAGKKILRFRVRSRP